WRLDLGPRSAVARHACGGDRRGYAAFRRHSFPAGKRRADGRQNRTGSRNPQTGSVPRRRVDGPVSRNLPPHGWLGWSPMSELIPNLQRLAAMPPQELAHRGREQWRITVDRVRGHRVPHVPAFKEYLRAAPAARFYGGDRAELCAIVKQNFP